MPYVVWAELFMVRYGYIQYCDAAGLKSAGRAPKVAAPVVLLINVSVASVPHCTGVVMVTVMRLPILTSLALTVFVGDKEWFAINVPLWVVAL